MVAYAVGGRKYTQWHELDAIEGVIHWDSRGFAPGSPSGGTHKPLRHNIYFYDGLCDVIVWQNGGSGGVGGGGGATSHKRLFHNAYVYDGLSGVILWQSAGTTSAPPPSSGTHKRLYHNIYDYDGLNDIFVWQSKGTSGAAPAAEAGYQSFFAFWMGGAGSFIPGIIPTPGPTHPPWFPPVPEYMPDDREHRRQMARSINALRQGKQNVTHDLTLTADATSTVLSDARIGISSAIIPAMATTSDAAAALVAGIWITDIKTGSCTVRHESSSQVDRIVRFVIIG